MFSQQNNQNAIAKTFSCKTLEGNWYEDRSTSGFNDKNTKSYSLKNPNEWQYNTTYNTIGDFNKNYPSLTNQFTQSNDNYINFQSKKKDMYASSYKYYYDKNYRDTFKDVKLQKSYYADKNDELKDYISNWTKRDQLFHTTYKEDLLKTFMMRK